MTSARPRLPDAARQALVLLFALAQLFAPALPSFGYGLPIGTRADLAMTPNTPAGYAFAIWSVIYLGCTAYAFWQAWPSQRAREIHRAVGPWLVAAFAANTAWPLIVQFDGLSVASVLVIGALLVALFGALERAQVATRGADRWLLRVTVGLFAGWITAASFANLAAMLLAEGHVTEDATPVWVTIAAGAAAFAAWAVVRCRAEPAYVFAVAWAGVALLARNWAERPGAPETGATFGLLLVLTLATLHAWRVRRGGSA
ncbi:MAG: hypothetical protein ACK53C_15905 [Pseudomonadota bacterium]